MANAELICYGNFPHLSQLPRNAKRKIIIKYEIKHLIIRIFLLSSGGKINKKYVKVNFKAFVLNMANKQ